MVEQYTTQKQICIKLRGSLPCTLSRTGVTVNADGDYVIKAGTPLYGADLGASRLTTSYTITSGDSATVQGILLNDVIFNIGETTASGTIVFDAIVDVLKLDSSVQALISTSVKTALTNIQFVNGRAD